MPSYCIHENHRHHRLGGAPLPDSVHLFQCLAEACGVALEFQAAPHRLAQITRKSSAALPPQLFSSHQDARWSSPRLARPDFIVVVLW
jgi:hypothetical protein